MHFWVRNPVELKWVKDHIGHHGNEMADKLANNGCSIIKYGPEPFLPVPKTYT
jgi:ribonuclease HI